MGIRQGRWIASITCLEARLLMLIRSVSIPSYD